LGVTTPQPSSVVVEVLLEMAKIDALSRCWRTMDDIARIIQAIYDLPPALELTSEHIQSQLTRDACTASTVDSWSSNNTGIYRDKYRVRVKEQSTTNRSRPVRCLYLCKPGCFPPKPTPGVSWSDEVVDPLPSDWVPTRGFYIMNNQREKLKKLLRSSSSSTSTKNNKQSPARKRKSDKAEDLDGASSKKSPKLSHKVWIRLLGSHDDVIQLEVDENTVKIIMENVRLQCKGVLPSTVLWSQESTDTPTNHSEPKQCISSDVQQNSSLQTTAIQNKTNNTNDEEVSTLITPTIIKDTPTNLSKPDQVDGETSGRSSEVQVTHPNNNNNINDDVTVTGRVLPAVAPPVHEKLRSRRQANYRDVSVTVNGVITKIEKVPVTYEVVHKVQCSILDKAKQELTILRKSLEKEKFCGGDLANRLYASAIVLSPGLSFTAAETLIPIIVAAFLAQSSGESFSLDKYSSLATSFPSAAHLQKCIMGYAVDCLMEVAEELHNAEAVYLTSDKGNKKGLGHFVKILSWWDNKLERVQMFTLDIDASEGTSSGCADAVEHSMKKLFSAIKLSGQLTDSGGGGVLEDFASELKKRNLCHDIYHVANCTLHAIQLALSNPVKAAFQDGGLGSRNMMQMLHSIYDLQQSMELATFVGYLKKGQGWAAVNRSPAQPTATNEDQFLVDWWELLSFVPNVFDETAPIKKCPAAVLTRWWYVGMAAEYAAEHYLAIFRACQMIVNDYGASSSPNMIASALYSLMLEQQIFADLVFFRIFHNEFLVEHFEWLQLADCLTKEPGFRSHQIALRYYIMDNDINNIATQLENESRFVDWRTTISILKKEKQTEQLKKVRIFVEQAKKSLRTHFDRWINTLLPFALGESPQIAQIVAKRILSIQCAKDNAVNPTIRQTTEAQEETNGVREWVFLESHERHIVLPEFASFLRDRAKELPQSFDPLFQSLTNTIARGIDIWDKKETEGVQQLAKMFKQKCLALPSNGHMAERGVKEAKIVAATGRQEEMRSAMAICRSVLNPACKGEEGKTKAKKVLELIVQQHRRLSEKNTPANQKIRNTVGAALKSEHFKKERLGNKEKAMDNNKKNKKKNVAQKKTGVDVADRVAGKVAFGAIAKNKFIMAVDEEMEHRGLSRLMEDPKNPGKTKEAGIKEKVKRLREHESKRLGATDISSFEPLSGVMFNVEV
jgi:hypothetical protein